MVQIHLEEVGKAFDSPKQHHPVIVDINLTIASGEVLSVRGDNGSGKTTLLNILAGIDKPTNGRVYFEGLSGETLRVGYAQQDYTSSLLPWFDVLENVAIPLRLRGIPKIERRDRAEDVLDSLGFKNLPPLAYPHQLSGGQKQKVAIARALIHQPHLLLLDEPFSNLDARTSRDLQETLSEIHELRRPTMVYVSHELDHSIYLADRVLVLFGSPARVVREFIVSFKRPRRRELVLQKHFNEIRADILAQEERLYADRSLAY